MSKILYPVGTPVTVRKSPETDGLVVTQYKKGEKYPYRLGYYPGDEVFVNGKSKFSVRGLKRYSPTQTLKKSTFEEAMARADQQAEKKCDCITRDEVEKMIASVVSDIYQDLGMSVQEVNNKVMMAAEISDINFRTVARQFKTLNHDDD